MKRWNEALPTASRYATAADQETGCICEPVPGYGRLGGQRRIGLTLPDRPSLTCGVSYSRSMREQNEADSSGSTAEFRAFVGEYGPEATQPWAMRAPRKRVALLAAAVVGAAVLLALIALFVIR